MIPTDPFKTYTSPKGKEYRVTGVEKLEDTKKWINNSFSWCWEVSIEYLETKQRLKLIYDYKEKVIKKSLY